MSSEQLDFSFDGTERSTGGDAPCPNCGEPFHEHEKERYYPEKGPAGAYSYRYLCGV